MKKNQMAKERQRTEKKTKKKRKKKKTEKENDSAVCMHWDVLLVLLAISNMTMTTTV